MKAKRILQSTALLWMCILILAGCTAKSPDITVATAASTETSEIATKPTVVPTAVETTAAGIADFADLNTDKVSLVALGNSDVPVGQYSQELLTNLGIWDAIQSKISFCGNVKEVLSQVAAGSVDCGIVYATDAATEPKVSVVATASSDLITTPVVYPAATLKDSQNPEVASAFLNFLMSDEAKSEFEKVGFTYIANGNSGTTTTDKKCTLTIFAAASLTEALTAVGDLFMKANPNVELVFNFDSSGTLQTQIESGANADVFFSAAQKQMTALSDGGYLAEGSKIDLLQNSVVLIVPKS